MDFEKLDFENLVVCLIYDFKRICEWMCLDFVF